MGKKANFKKLISNIAKDAIEYICDYQEYDYKQIINEVIDDYYHSYSPMYYRRAYSLYNAYKIYNNSKTVDVYFGPDFMGNKHRANDEYIYHWMFEEGWHGGARNRSGNKVAYIDEETRERTGEWIYYKMLYRTPHPLAIAAGKAKGPAFKKWSSTPVEQAPFSPYEMINKKLDKYDKKEFDNRIRQGLELALEKYGII